MTAINRNLVILGMTLLSLAALGAVFTATQSPDAASGGLHIPVVVIIEIVVYFIACMVTNPRATLGMAFGSAIVLTLVRAVASLAGGLIYLSSVMDSSTMSFAAGWASPVAVIIGVAALVMAGPYLIAIVLPGLVGDQAANELLGAAKATKRRDSISPTGLETSPSGGFVQVFSYDELAGLFKKGSSLAGAVIYSSEGLPLWSDLPTRGDLDSLTARIYQQTLESGHAAQAGALGRSRRLMVETREFLLVSTILNPHFGLLLVFHSRTPVEEALAKVGLLARSTREFLQWKYSAIPMAQISTSSDRVSLEL